MDCPSSRRRVIIPAGTLNSDQINIIEVPRDLQNVNVPLLVTPAKRGLQAQPLSHLQNLRLENPKYRDERQKLAVAIRNQTHSEFSAGRKPSLTEKPIKNDGFAENISQPRGELSYTGDGFLRNPPTSYNTLRNLQGIPTQRTPNSLTRAQMGDRYVPDLKRVEAKSQEGMDAQRMRRMLAGMGPSMRSDKNSLIGDQFSDQFSRQAPPCEPLCTNLRNVQDETLVYERYQHADMSPGNESSDIEEDCGSYSEPNYSYVNSYYNRPVSHSFAYVPRSQDEYSRSRNQENGLGNINSPKISTQEGGSAPGKTPQPDFSYKTYEQPSSNPSGVYDHSPPKHWDNQRYRTTYEAQDIAWDQSAASYDWPENVEN